jgi:hypothetical protein
VRRLIMAKKTTKKAPAKKSTKAAKAAPAKKAEGTKPKAAKPAAKKKASGEPKEKKTSALDAAARVLAESKEPLNTKQMIEAMATKGYWTSPGGKTPHATLYAAILRELNVKGKDARFKKTDRGHFILAK